MEIARVNVSGVACTPESASTIPRGLVGGTVSITYTDTFWNDLTKTAVFQGACTKVVPVAAAFGFAFHAVLSIGKDGIHDQ